MPLPAGIWYGEQFIEIVAIVAEQAGSDIVQQAGEKSQVLDKNWLKNHLKKI